MHRRHRRRDDELLERAGREAGHALRHLPVPRAERALPRAGGGRRPADEVRRQDAVGQGAEPAERRHRVARRGRRVERDGRPLRRRAGDRARAHRGDAAQRSPRPHVLRRRPGRQRHEVEDVQAARGPRQRAQRLQVDEPVARARPRALLADQEHDAGRVRLARQLRPAGHRAPSPGDGRPLERLRPRRPREREPQRGRLPPVPRPGPLPRRQHVAAEDAAAGHLRSGSPTRRA